MDPCKVSVFDFPLRQCSCGGWASSVGSGTAAWGSFRMQCSSAAMRSSPRLASRFKSTAYWGPGEVACSAAQRLIAALQALPAFHKGQRRGPARGTHAETRAHPSFARNRLHRRTGRLSPPLQVQGSEPGSLSICQGRRRHAPPFRTAFAHLLGLTDPCSTGVHIEPFATTAFKVLV